MIDRREASLAVSAVLAALVLHGGAAAQTEPPAPWRASGNEPSWTLTRTADSLTLVTEMGARTVSAPLPKATRLGPKTLRYSTAAQGRPMRVTVARGICADSMSGMPHPERVSVSFGGRTYKGCGGEPASLLRGEAWRVVRIGDKRVGPAVQVTMLFDAEGRVSGKGGCNQYSAGVTLTGEGLSFQKGLSTMMACEPPLMDTERAFLDRIEKINRFSMENERRLVLHAADGSTIVAERRP